ncbi:MAG TPA: Zn-binding domain-containing protein, partial [Dehalococcoidales bacterium]|nr:Zn-binding domain-containing protein [Dehalococcoidales bacterium]
YILRAHLLCAAWEQGLSKEDTQYFGPNFQTQIEELVATNELKERHGRWFLSPSIAQPARNINIRSTSGVTFALIDTSTGSLLETIEADDAFFQVHPGAIYLHQGESYLVTNLDLITHTAYCLPSDANYYTQTKELSDLKILKVWRTKHVGNVEVSLGEVEVTTTVIGYKRKSQFTEEVLGEEVLDLPPVTINTVSLWFDIPDKSIKRIETEELDFAGAIHAVEHAAIGILPLFALCDRNDIGGLSTPLHPDTGKPQIFIHDGHPGGVGIAEKGYEIITELWQATLDTVKNCPCQEGCPSCIQSPKCGNNNKPLDKKAALILLEQLVFNSKKANS